MTDERRTVSPSRVLGGSVGRPFYGDGAPHWREGRGQGRPSGLAAEAEREVDLLVKSLRREGHREETPLLGGVQDDLLSLAVRIESCSGRRPCLSGACPCCRRALKRLFVYATRYIIYPGGPETLMVCAVWRRARIGLDELPGDDLFDPTRERLDRALERANTPVLGGLDVSLNEHEAGHFEAHWSPHAHLFAPSSAMRRGEAEFAKWFRRDDVTRQPLRIQTFDGRRVGRAYALKSDFMRRTSLEPTTRSDGRRSTYSTRGKPIWGVERAELALALDRAGLDARLYLRGYELVIDGGKVEIVRSTTRLGARTSTPAERDRHSPNSRR